MLIAAALTPAAAAAAWGPGVRIAPPDASGLSSPDVAAGGGGRALAVWLRGSGSGVRALVASGVRGRWSRPRAISGPGAARPRVAMNDRGDAAVVWIVQDGLGAAVRRGPSGRWSTARVARSQGAVRDLRVVVDRAGRPTVLWSEADGADWVARVAARASPRAGWSVRPPRIATPGPDPPELSLAARSGALVGWREGAVARASATSRSAFEPARQIAGNTDGRPALAIARVGGMLAAWTSLLPGGTRVVQASDRPGAGGPWGSAQDVGIGSGPLVSLGDGGDAVLAWGLGAGQTQGVVAATRPVAGAGWRSSPVVGAQGCACLLQPAGLALDPNGTAVVAWRRREGDRTTAGGVAALPGGSQDWMVATPAEGRPDAPPVVAAAGGTAVALWVAPGTGVRASVLRR